MHFFNVHHISSNMASSVSFSGIARIVLPFIESTVIDLSVSVENGGEIVLYYRMSSISCMTDTKKTLPGLLVPFLFLNFIFFTSFLTHHALAFSVVRILTFFVISFQSRSCKIVVERFLEFVLSRTDNIYSQPLFLFRTHKFLSSYHHRVFE